MQRLHFTCNRKICSHQHMNSMLQNFQGTGHYQCILIYKYIYIYIVEPQSIVPATIVFPHVPFAIFGPE